MAKDKPQPQTGPEIEEYSTTATPKAYAGSVPVFCAHEMCIRDRCTGVSSRPE